MASLILDQTMAQGLLSGTNCRGAAGLTIAFHSMTRLAPENCWRWGIEREARCRLREFRSAYDRVFDPNGVGPSIFLRSQVSTQDAIFYDSVAPGGSVSAYGGFIDLIGTGTSKIVSCNQNGSNTLRTISPGTDFPTRWTCIRSLRMGATYLASGISAVDDLTVQEEMLSQILVSPAFNLCESLCKRRRSE